MSRTYTVLAGNRRDITWSFPLDELSAPLSTGDIVVLRVDADGTGSVVDASDVTVVDGDPATVTAIVRFEDALPSGRVVFTVDGDVDSLDELADEVVFSVRARAAQRPTP